MSCDDTPAAPTTTSTDTTTVDPATLPAVTAVEPATGSADGGTEVVLTGTLFSGVTSVRFGSVQAITFSVTDDNTLTVTAPPGTLETVDVVVTTSIGSSATSDADHFTWVANELTGLTLSETSVRPGAAVRGTVKVRYPAPSSGIRVPIRWRSTPPNSTAIVTPATAVIPAGSSEGSFQITTYYVSTPEQIEIESEHWGVSQTAHLTLQP
jgi:hypothetical protein